MPYAPTIAPLDLGDRLKLRQLMTVAIVDAVTRVSSWADGQRRADDLLDELVGSGFEIFRVDWP